MHYNFVGKGFHSKTLCSRLSSSEVQFYTENGRGLKATFDVHLRLIGNSVEGFLLPLIELILLGITVEALRSKRD